MPHVFISYVRENSTEIERLADALRAYGVEVWLDKNQIKPGLRWADAIREAIGEGAFFIACFSRASSQRTRTYMNEEITIAIEVLRQRPTDQAWFIPVLLDDAEIPSRSIGAGDSLRSLQWVRLDDNWSRESLAYCRPLNRTARNCTAWPSRSPILQRAFASRRSTE